VSHSGLWQQLARLAETSRTGLQMSTSGQFLSAGLETRRAGTLYHWDGLRRRILADHAFIVLQYTLDGWGVYEENGQTQRLTPGGAFMATVPSPHVYRLPAESPGWSFFWVMFSHPYVVERFGRIKSEMGAVTTLDPDGLTVARMVRLFGGVCQGGFSDEWAQEQALFELLWEYERHEHGRRYATPLREQLLAEVRREVMETSDGAPDVAQLARTRGMSRSHFSHHFRAVTGLPPARFATQIRLEEVTRRLLQTDDTLASISSATGFADANHLCKVFRRHYHLSPGAFRRQMR